MGFRSTFVSSDFKNNWPDWFVEKYPNIYANSDNKGVLCSKFEIKAYFEDEFFTDIQKAIGWEIIDKFVLVYLHECGGISRVQVNKNNILISEPTDWENKEDFTHWYCYGCSDANEA